MTEFLVTFADSDKEVVNMIVEAANEAEAQDMVEKAMPGSTVQSVQESEEPIAAGSGAE